MIVTLDLVWNIIDGWLFSLKLHALTHAHTIVDTDDEYFCDNINRTLPSSLVQDLPPPDVMVNPSQGQFGGASPLTSPLFLPALTAVLLLATLLVLQ